MEKDEANLAKKCFDASLFQNLSKEEARTLGAICNGLVTDFVDDYNLGPKNAMGLYTKKQYDLYNSLNKAIVEGQGLTVPPANNPPVLFGKLMTALKPMDTALETVVEETVLPFLEGAYGNASFSLSVGPGSEVYQMYPHDDAFVDRIYKTKTKNVVMVVEGSTEGQFGDNYASLFASLYPNPWVDSLLMDIRETFVLPDDTPLEITKFSNTVATLQFFFNDYANEMLFVFYLGDYEKDTIDPLVRVIVENTSFNTLLCGIRHGPCNELFFQESSLYYDNFHLYAFLHGEWATKPMKNQPSVYRMNLRRMKNAGISRNALFNSVTRQPNNTEAMGYGVSKLCTRGVRPPSEEEAFCARGVANERIFWNGLGGRRKTRRGLRKNRKNKKTRKQ